MASRVHIPPPSMSRHVSFVLLAAALAAIWAWRLTARRASAPTPAEPTPAPVGLDRSQSLTDVQRIVAERNRAAKKDEDAFRADGWQMVVTDPPDHRVTSFDPALIARGREEDLRHQLVTTVPAAGDVRNVARIAVEASDQRTRFAAVDALAHSRADEAQAALIDLLIGGQLDADDFVRRQIAPLLRPRDLDDPIALRMAALLDDPRLTAVERRQIAFTLGLVSIRAGMTLPEATLASLSPDARARLDEARALATQRIALHARPARETD